MDLVCLFCSISHYILVPIVDSSSRASKYYSLSSRYAQWHRGTRTACLMMMNTPPRQRASPAPGRCTQPLRSATNSLQGRVSLSLTARVCPFISDSSSGVPRHTIGMNTVAEELPVQRAKGGNQQPRRCSIIVNR